MPWETVAKCDECGKVKGEANKWMLIYVDHPLSEFTIRLWPKHGTAIEPEWAMLCSEACLQKRLGAFLAQRTKEAPANLQEIKE
jgi:hypothetical protein